MKTIQDINFKDKKALIRVDFNVPLNNELVVTDATRIEAAKPTIVKIIARRRELRGYYLILEDPKTKS